VYQETVNHHYFFSVTNVPISFLERRRASSIRAGSSFTNLSQDIKPVTAIHLTNNKINISQKCTKMKKNGQKYYLSTDIANLLFFFHDDFHLPWHYRLHPRLQRRKTACNPHFINWYKFSDTQLFSSLTWVRVCSPAYVKDSIEMHRLNSSRTTQCSAEQPVVPKDLRKKHQQMLNQHFYRPDVLPAAPPTVSEHKKPRSRMTASVLTSETCCLHRANVHSK